jgi:hypothetical protein
MSYALWFWGPLGVIALALAMVLGARASRRAALGRMLWFAPDPPYRWAAAVWTVLLVMNVFDHQKIWNRHLAANLVLTVFFSLVTLIAGFQPGVFSVHEDGLVVGLLCLPWSRIAGWSWGPKNPWDREAEAAPVALDLTGSAPAYLYLWTSSPGRFLYAIGRRPIKTGVARDAELDKLLRRYAPQGGVPVGAA